MVEARLFQALSDATRLKILSLLAREPMNVSRMVSRLGCAQPAVSRHLRVLREAALIHDKRKGKEVEYSLNYGQVSDATEYLGKLLKAAPVSGAAKGGSRTARGTATGMTGSKRAAAGSATAPAGAKAAKSAPRATAKPPKGKARGRRRVAAKPKPRKRAKDDAPEYAIERNDDTMDDFLL